MSAGPHRSLKVATASADSSGKIQATADASAANVVEAVPDCLVCSCPSAPSVDGLFDTRFGIPGTFSVQRCQQCGMEQLSSRPDAADLKDLYERFYNFSGERGTLYTRIRERFLSSILYRLWIRLDGDISFHTCRGAGCLLDIGCNEGRTLKRYAANGFTAEGTELNENAAAVARAAGFRVFTGPLEDLIPSVPYDIAVLSNVLEHALDPKAMLESVRRLLKPGGHIWISCPNRDSWLRSVFRRRWINWHVPFHISHFSGDALRKLLGDCGFLPMELRQITPALWVASSIVALLFARRGKPTRQLRNPFLMCGLVLACRLLLFPLLYWGNRVGRGDCLVAVAVKVRD